MKSRLVKIKIFESASAGPGDLFDWEPVVKTREIRPLKQDPSGRRTGGMLVHGNSMNGDLIHDGDIVIYLKTGFALPGSVVVAKTPWGNFVKRFHPKPNGTIELVSSNPLYKIQIWPADEVILLGIVKRVERDF